ncbi:MAG: ribonuclease P protein component [Opitutaceae bacterium]|jgi:ribonuclease P protein component
MRFRPEQHIRRQAEIKALREKGRRVDCGAFTLWWLERSDVPAGAKPGPRVCVVASIAAVGRAVLRNRAKRRLRELFRRHQEKIGARIDLMLLARAAVNKLDYPVLEERFLQACNRLPRADHPKNLN